MFVFKNCLCSLLCFGFFEMDKQVVGRLYVYSFDMSFLMINMFIVGWDVNDFVGQSIDFGDFFGNGLLVLVVGVFGVDVEGEIFMLLNELM